MDVCHAETKVNDRWYVCALPAGHDTIEPGSTKTPIPHGWVLKSQTTIIADELTNDSGVLRLGRRRLTTFVEDMVPHFPCRVILTIEVLGD